jgi:hypothetical protein
MQVLACALLLTPHHKGSRRRLCEHVDKSRVENVSAEGLFDLLPGGIVMLLIRISKLFNTCKAGSLSSTAHFL